MQLPPHAKRVFQGIIYDTYQWEQELFDGSTATFEMLKRVNSIRVLATQGNNIIIAKEQQSGVKTKEFYGFFGGRQDKENETPEECALRELKEETGFVPQSLTLFSTYEPSDKMDFTVYTYIARDCQQVSAPNQDSGEKIVPLALTFDEFLNIAASDDFVEKQFAFELLRMRFLFPEKFEGFKKMLFE